METINLEKLTTEAIESIRGGGGDLSRKPMDMDWRWSPYGWQWLELQYPI